MEILTPNTSKVKEQHDRSQVFVSFRGNGSGMHISKEAMRQFVLKADMRVTFVIDIDRLYFYLSSKEADGFVISKGRHESGVICSRLLVRRIYERLPPAKKNGTRYGVRVSNTRINECATFEILLHQRL